MSVLTQEQIDALNNFARTHPHLAKVFDYLASGTKEGLGDALNDAVDEGITLFDGDVIITDDRFHLNPNQFYFTVGSGGDPIVNTISEGGGGVSDHGGLNGLADDDHLQYLLVDGTRAMIGHLNMGSKDVTNAHKGRYSDSVAAAGFYLNPGVNGIGRSLVEDIISFDIPVLSVDTYFFESFVDQGFIIDDLHIITSSGSSIVGFYILGDGKSGIGRGITGLDPITIGTTKKIVLPTGNNVVRTGDSLLMSAFYIDDSSVKHLRGRLKIKLSG